MACARGVSGVHARDILHWVAQAGREDAGNVNAGSFLDVNHGKS